MAAPEMKTTVATAAPTPLDTTELQTTNDALKLLELPVELTDRIDARVTIIRTSPADREAALHEADVLTMLAAAVGYHHDAFLEIQLLLMGYATNGEHGSTDIVEKSAPNRDSRVVTLYYEMMSKAPSCEIPVALFLAAHDFYYDKSIEKTCRESNTRWPSDTLEELDALVAALDAIEAGKPVVPDPTRGWGGGVSRSGGPR